MPSIERHAGLLERFYIARDRLKFDTCVTVAAQYTGRDPLNRSSVFPALRKVLQAHRALSVQVHDADTLHAVFVRLQAVDLSQVVVFHSSVDAGLQAIVPSILTTHMETGGSLPLWRLHVLAANWLVFAYHHVIGDGKSGVAFHRALLTAMNQTKGSEGNDASAVVAIPQSLSLVPSLEASMDLTVSLSKLGRIMYEMLAPTSWTSLGSAYTGNPVLTENTFDISVRLLKIPPADAGRLLALCRHHGATLTSFLHTIGLVVLSDLVSLMPESFSTIATSIPISLRQYTNTPNTAFCNHFSSHVSSVDLLHLSHDLMLSAHTFPWDAASQLAATLRQNGKASREQIGLLKYLSGPYEDFFLSKQGKKRTETMELSNLGRFPPDINAPPEDPSWSIEDMFFMQNNAVCGAAIKVMVVGSPAGSVGITFNWTKGDLEDNVAELFVSRFGELVNVLLQQESL